MANATTWVEKVGCSSTPKATCGNSYEANNSTVGIGCKWHDTENKCKSTLAECKISGTSCSD